jgi:hypothetical protein
MIWNTSSALEKIKKIARVILTNCNIKFVWQVRSPKCCHGYVNYKTCVERTKKLNGKKYRNARLCPCVMDCKKHPDCFYPDLFPEKIKPFEQIFLVGDS